MKRIALAAGFVSLSVLATLPATAADFGPRQSYRPIYKAPAYTPVIFSWSGFYAGVNGGYGWGTSRVSDPITGTTEANVRGALLGGTLGYNYQFGAFVAGVEGDLAYSWIKGQDFPLTVVDGGVETRNTYLGTARGRLGYAFDRFLPYVTGGYAYGGLQNKSAIGSETHARGGYTLGGGLEYAFLGNWSVKAEYLYVKLNDSVCSAATCFLDSTARFQANIVRAGLNYRF